MRGSLKVISSNVPITVRAIKLDDRLVAVGWYAYKAVTPAADEDYPDDTLAIHGHQEPGVLISAGKPGFEEMAALVNRVQALLGSKIILRIEQGELK